MNIELIHNIGAIALLMLANTLLGVGIANKTDSFEWSIFWKGIVKYLFILGAVALIYVSGLLVPNTAVITFNEQELTILTALDIFSLVVLIIYAKKCFENLKSIFEKYTDETIDIEIGGTDIDILSNVKESEELG